MVGYREDLIPKEWINKESDIQFDKLKISSSRLLEQKSSLDVYFKEKAAKVKLASQQIQFSSNYKVIDIYFQD